MGKMKVGLIGCGMIGEIYLKNCIERFGNTDVVACADILPDAALKRAGQFGLRACSVDELLEDQNIKVVINLTPPNQHAPVSMAILHAGKHVYSEKPLAISLEDGIALVKYAEEHDLYIGCAPDTFLGGGLQTCRRLLEEEAIGKPFAGQAFMLSCGPEVFHPNPEFFYKEGAGPTLDWGPYYISSLVSLLGPVKRVYAVGQLNSPMRKVLAENSPKSGETFTVEVPTYVTSIMEFVSGEVVNLTLSFDMKFPYFESRLPYIQLYGSDGVLTLPDTNKYEGPIYLRDGSDQPEEIPLQYGFTDNCRGMGLSDMIHAIETGESYRANGEFALHTLEVLLKILESAKQGEFCDLETTCVQPQPIPEGLPDQLFD